MGSSTSRYHPDAVGSDTLPWQPVSSTASPGVIVTSDDHRVKEFDANASTGSLALVQRQSQVGPMRVRPSSTSARSQPVRGQSLSVEVDSAPHSPGPSSSILSRVSLQPRDSDIPEEAEEGEGVDGVSAQLGDLSDAMAPSDRGHTPTPLPEPLAEALKAGLGTAAGSLAAATSLSPPAITRRGTGETDRERLLAYWAAMDKDRPPSVIGAERASWSSRPPSGQGWTSEWIDSRGVMNPTPEEDSQSLEQDHNGQSDPRQRVASHSSLLSAAAASSSCDPDLSSPSPLPAANADLIEFGSLHPTAEAVDTSLSSQGSASAARRHTLTTLNTLNSARSSRFSDTTALHTAIDQLRAGPTPQIDTSASDLFADESAEPRKKGSFHLMDKLIGRVRRSSEAKAPPLEVLPPTSSQLERAASGNLYNFPSRWPRTGARQRALSAAAQFPSLDGSASAPDGLSSGMSDATARPPVPQRTTRRSLLRRRKTSDKTLALPIPVSTIAKRRSGASIGKRSPRSKRSSLNSLRSVYRAGERGEHFSGAEATSGAVTPSSIPGSQGRASLRRTRPVALGSIKTDVFQGGSQAESSTPAETPVSSPPASMRLTNQTHEGESGWEDVDESSDAKPSKSSRPNNKRPWSWSKRTQAGDGDAWGSHSRSASEKESSQVDEPSTAPEPLAVVEHHHGDIVPSAAGARLRSPTSSFSSLKPTPAAGPVPPPRRQVRRKGAVAHSPDSACETCSSPTIAPQQNISTALLKESEPHNSQGAASSNASIRTLKSIDIPIGEGGDDEKRLSGSSAGDGARKETGSPVLEPVGMVAAAVDEPIDGSPTSTTSEGQEVRLADEAASEDEVTLRDISSEGPLIGGRRGRGMPVPSLSPVQEVTAASVQQHQRLVSEGEVSQPSSTTARRRPLPTPPANASISPDSSAFANVDVVGSLLAGQTSTGSFQKHAGEDLSARRRLSSVADSESSARSSKLLKRPLPQPPAIAVRNSRSFSLDSATVPPSVTPFVRPMSHISDKSDATLPAPSPARPARATPTRAHGHARDASLSPSNHTESSAVESLRSMLPGRTVEGAPVSSGMYPQESQGRQRAASAPLATQPQEDTANGLAEGALAADSTEEAPEGLEDSPVSADAAPFAGGAVQASLAALAALEDKDVDDPSIAWRRERLLGVPDGSSYLGSWLSKGDDADLRRDFDEGSYAQSRNSGSRPRRRAKPYPRRSVGISSDDVDVLSSSGTELTSSLRPAWASPSSMRRRRSRSQFSTGPRGHFLHPTDAATIGASSSLSRSLREAESIEHWDQLMSRSSKRKQRRSESASRRTPVQDGSWDQHRPIHSREPTSSTMYEDALEQPPLPTPPILHSPSSMHSADSTAPVGSPDSRLQARPSVLSPAPSRSTPALAPSVQEWDEMIVPALRKRLAEEEAFEYEMARQSGMPMPATPTTNAAAQQPDEGPVPFPTQYSPEHSKVVGKLENLARHARERSKTFANLGMGYPGQNLSASREDLSTGDVRSSSVMQPRPDSRIGAILHAETRSSSYDSPLQSPKQMWSSNRRGSPKDSPRQYVPSIQDVTLSSAQASVSSRRGDGRTRERARGARDRERERLLESYGHGSSRHLDSRHADSRHHRSRTTSLSSRPVPTTSSRSKRPSKQGFSGEDIMAWQMGLGPAGGPVPLVGE